MYNPKQKLNIFSRKKDFFFLILWTSVGEKTLEKKNKLGNWVWKYKYNSKEYVIT